MDPFNDIIEHIRLFHSVYIFTYTENSLKTLYIISNFRKRHMHIFGKCKLYFLIFWSLNYNKNVI